VQLRTDGMDGCATLVLLRQHWPTIGRLALCEEADDEMCARAITAHAQALVPLGADAGALAAALADVQAGCFHMNALVKALFELKGRLAPRRRKGDACPLTAKQMETLCWKAHPGAFPESKIAAQLGVELSTVRSHMKEVCRKLGVHTGGEAVRRAQKLGLLPGWRS
jgi:DNA-binding NarL/FixJ family response regulator